MRKGDGTGLSAKGFSEVRKGDGTVLWNAIPDSEIHHHPGTEGSGTAIADVVGSADLTLNTDDWISESGYEGGVGFNMDGDNSATASLTQPTARTRIIRFDAGALSGQTLYVFSHNPFPALGYSERGDVWRYSDGADNQITISDATVPNSGIWIAVVRMDSSTQYLGLYDNAKTLQYENTRSNPNTTYDGSTFYLGQQGGGARHWSGSVDPNMETFDAYLTDQEVTDVLDARF